MNDKEKDDLVAYLDGELDEAASREMEAKLSLDAEARAEAEAMRRTWELLDYLPVAEPSPGFTHQTLDRIATLQSAKIGRAAWPRLRPWLFGLIWIVALLLAGLLSFLVAQRLRATESSDRALLRDQRLLENKRLYENVESYHFLLDLSHPSLFGGKEPEF